MKNILQVLLTKNTIKKNVLITALNLTIILDYGREVSLCRVVQGISETVHQRKEIGNHGSQKSKFHFPNHKICKKGTLLNNSYLTLERVFEECKIVKG